MRNVDFREKYRPKALKEVIGNERPKRAIINMIKKGEIRKGVFFHGPVGTAKTTLARLLVKGLHCENFTDDVCGKCGSCISFEERFPESDHYGYHDCSKMSGKQLDEILKSLGYGFGPGILTFSTSTTRLHIHIFDEFHRAKEPLQDKFLIPLETCKDVLLIFCSIEPKVIPAFRRRTLSLETTPPEISQLLPWLGAICRAEKIPIKDGNALRQVAETAHRLPGDCVRILEQFYLEEEPLSTSLVMELGQDSKFTIVEN
jgi:DNA polymerase III delta prime subunit